MITTMKPYLLPLLLFFTAGCNLPDKGIVDTAPPPLIISASTEPTTIDVNHLALLPSDRVDTTIVLMASVNNLDAGATVSYTIFDPEGNSILSGELADNGLYPDLRAGDGLFSAIADFHILKRDVGAYAVQIYATGGHGFTSNTILQTLAVKNSNDHAPFLSNLMMPDTVQIPPLGDTTFVKITITASDSEGLGDIVSVKLLSQKPNGTSAGQFNLYDDGGKVVYVQFGGPLTSGDDVAGDGIYTITIPLTVPGEKPPTFRDFSFIATDRSSESSNVLTQRIYIVQ